MQTIRITTMQPDIFNGNIIEMTGAVGSGTEGIIGKNKAGNQLFIPSHNIAMVEYLPEAISPDEIKHTIH